MPEQWYAVCRKATGEAVSFGTVLPDRLPDDLEAIPIDHQPGAGEAWDAATRSIVKLPPPPPPPLQEAIATILDAQSSLYRTLPQALVQLADALRVAISAQAAMTPDAAQQQALQQQAQALDALKATLGQQEQELAAKVARMQEAKAGLEG